MTDLVLPGPTTPRSQRMLSLLGLVAVVASALVGGNFLGMRETLWGSESPEARPAAASRDAAAKLRAPPDDGAGTRRDRPAVPALVAGRHQAGGQGLDDAPRRSPSARTPSSGGRNGRARPAGSSSGRRARPGRSSTPPVPAPDTGYSVRKGAVALEVTADGPWTLAVDQQVDLPLNEPPLPVMSAPGHEVILTGSLYRMDQVGTGTLNIYQTADGRHLLRLDSFFVTANVDSSCASARWRRPGRPSSS